MSAGAPSLHPAQGLLERPRSEARAAATRAGRPWLRLATFTALAGYGLVRWATLIRPEPGWRLLGLLALAVALAAGVPVLNDRSRAAAAGASVVILLLAFPVSGLRWHWLTHVRIVATADRIERGLNLLPNALVPYLGANHDVRMVIVLGAAVLVLDAAAVLAFGGGWGASLSDGRRAAAALPLIALAVVPSTLIRPELPYMQGLLLFGLLTAFMWGERVRAGAAASAVGLVALAGVGAAIVAPRVDQGSPWVDYRAWAGTTAAVHVDAFNWNQTYGPLRWPQTGHEVFTVQAMPSAGSGDYWKAEDLDTFNGYSWIGAPSPVQTLPQPSGEALSRWTRTLHISIVGMKTTDVIAAGEAEQPSQLPGGIAAGPDAGTWQSGTSMGPGATYVVRAYSPHPTPHQLAAAGRHYPAQALAGDLTLDLPLGAIPGAGVPVTFPLFGTHRQARTVGGAVPLSGATVARREVILSPYGRAYALARRLAARARTPYAFVMSVRNYLSAQHGFSYTQSPPRRQYPLESFLFDDREGYCQQFSGAMALLLRMGGIPARVAAGFTPGSFDRRSGRWVVTDIDAHAWVEAWFPTYGWVRFDATPRTAPARGGINLPAILKKLPGGATAADAAQGRREATGSAVTTAVTHHGAGGGGAGWWWLIAGGLVVLGALAEILRRVTRGHIARSDLLAELERALTRTGRPLPDGATLVGLERRLHSSPEAEAYVRALRMARYRGSEGAPTPLQRRALRRELGRGLGFIGRLRALWALPPRL